MRISSGIQVGIFWTPQVVVIWNTFDKFYCLAMTVKFLRCHGWSHQKI
jgi:hypothetical protein